MATHEIWSFLQLCAGTHRDFYIVCVKYSHSISFCARVCVAVCLSQVPLCWAQWQHEDGLVQRGALSQKDPLEAVRGHAALILWLCVALRVGAAGWGALWGAQVVHERQPILPAEVHEFNVADAWVKVDACWDENKTKSVGTDYENNAVFFVAKENLTSALGVGTLAGQVQVAQQVCREVRGIVGNISAFNGTSR